MIYSGKGKGVKNRMDWARTEHECVGFLREDEYEMGVE
jgi:hypothetical protein